MGKFDNAEKKRLLQDALKLVNDLAGFEVGSAMDDYDPEFLEELIDRAKKLTKSRWWDVPKT